MPDPIAPATCIAFYAWAQIAGALLPSLYSSAGRLLFNVVNTPRKVLTSYAFHAGFVSKLRKVRRVTGARSIGVK